LREYQGRYPEAEKIYREVLEARRRVLGEDHPDTIWSMHNVGAILMIEGRYVEAEMPIREAIERARRTLGEDHIGTLDMMSYLAVAISRQGRYDDAESLAREVFERALRTLGENHPSTWNTWYNLSCHAALHGERARALDWLRKAVEHGCRDADGIATDNDLRSLRGDPEFEALVARARRGSSGKETMALAKDSASN
jgi:tetratricopeptide (TPR) repeat protein